MKNKYFLIFLLAVALFGQACLKDNFDFDKLTKIPWNPEIAVPLVYSTLTIQDILTEGDKEGVIIVGPDQFCTLIYEGNLFSLRASDFIQFEEQNFGTTFKLNTPEAVTLTTSGTVTANFSQVINFNGGTNELDSMVFKSGNFGIDINSDFTFSGQLKITIPAAKKGGVIFSQTIPFTYNGSVPVLGSSSVDLTGYRFDMTMGGTTVNKFQVNYEVTFTGSGTATSANQLTVNSKISNISFERIFGYIGQQQLSPNKDTVLLKIFNNSLGGGSFTLVDPKAKITFLNSYGLPVAINFNLLQGYNPNANTIDLNTGALPTPFIIASPSVSEIGQEKETSFEFNSTNSGIKEFINAQPKFVIYQVNSLSNPSGKTQNFLLDTSNFKLNLDIEMPLYGSAKDFKVQDTVDFKFQKVEDNIESLILRTYISNGFPIEVKVQVYFTDSLYNKLDSLVMEPNRIIMPSPTISSTGRVTAPSERTTDITYNRARANRLKDARKMLVRAEANTPNGGNPANPVKFYADYRLNVKIGMQTKLNINL